VQWPQSSYQCIFLDFELGRGGGVDRVSGQRLLDTVTFISLAYKLICNEVIVMCTILIIVSGTFLEEMAAEYSKRMFTNTHDYI